MTFTSCNFMVSFYKMSEWSKFPLSLYIPFTLISIIFCTPSYYKPSPPTTTHMRTPRCCQHSACLMSLLLWFLSKFHCSDDLLSSFWFCRTFHTVWSHFQIVYLCDNTTELTNLKIKNGYCVLDCRIRKAF